MCIVTLALLSATAMSGPTFAEPPAPLFIVGQSPARGTAADERPLPLPPPPRDELPPMGESVQGPDPFAQSVDSQLLQQIEEQLAVRPLRELEIQIAPPAAAPAGAADEFFGRAGTIDEREVPAAWIQRTYSSHFAHVYHRPLYFEEVNLERYGYYWGKLQPSVSSIRFFATLPLLPYKMTAEPPCSCQSTWEHAPAGTCAPPEPLWKPLEVDALFSEGLAVAGAILLFP